ncbi:sodium/calcium exchanger membrane region [Lucifera butyrica]|uniref:Sodium/calcium exchanger membrane region n=1 Tax=Lucifera butyrica TaxID=1351585 RepID=A0A498RAW8_9FIRM|nr:sodium:calcium antiporter [Lucifera butyrica]VBB08359.1 sodium/calcium exchanger membrane region [Lucifera butyrica]
MLDTVLILAASAGLIYISCELFVNGIEWVGKKFNIAGQAVGTVLAAFGTALPESTVTLVAVVFGANAGEKNIGVGAALGGPLILSTIGYAVIGWSMILFRRRQALSYAVDVNDDKLSGDQLWFSGLFFLNGLLGLVTFPAKRWLGLLFFLAYGGYIYKEMHAAGEEAEPVEPEPLKFRPRRNEPETGWVLVQTALSLLLIFIGSQLFVKRLELISGLLNVPSHFIALFLSPLATELPEILNALIWIRQGKERLALGNVSGSMMIQATIPSGLGILFTAWRFDLYLILAAITALLSIAYLWLTLRRRTFSAGRLSLAAVFYLLFAAIVFYVRWTGRFTG